jgi:hypothetical protein
MLTMKLPCSILFIQNLIERGSRLFPVYRLDEQEIHHDRMIIFGTRGENLAETLLDGPLNFSSKKLSLFKGS